MIRTSRECFLTISRFEPYGFHAMNSGVRRSPVNCRVFRHSTGMTLSLSRLVVYLTHPRRSSPVRPELGERISRGIISLMAAAEAWAESR